MAPELNVQARFLALCGGEAGNNLFPKGREAGCAPGIVENVGDIVVDRGDAASDIASNRVQAGAVQGSTARGAGSPSCG